MENDFIAIILSHSFASSEYNFEIINELISEFEWNGWGVQGVINGVIEGVAVARSDMRVGMTMLVVALMTSQST